MAGALTSLKILDFSTLLPGPYATMLLSDMGAEVLRVESPGRMDLVRLLPPLVGKSSAAHAYLNRGKQSLALDLKKEGAAEVIYRLVEQYDIVIEQFRPGVMDKLGVGYERLREIKPELIYCAITGYGQTGPYRDRAGHDLNYLSLAGVADYSRREGQAPIPLGIQVADLAGGSHHAVMAILAAVIHRQKAGEGQFLDISMTDAVFSMHAMSAAGLMAGGEVPGPESGFLNGGRFYDYYETADGRFFSLAGLEPQFVQGICIALENPQIAARGLSQRAEDQAFFKDFLRQRIKEKSFQYWTEFFSERDLCAEPVLSMQEAVSHPQIKARTMSVDVERWEGNGTIEQPGFPIKFSRSTCRAAYSGAPLGADTEAVLARAGYSEDEVNRMRASKLFG